MTRTTPKHTWITPAQVAEQFGVAVGKVLKWIQRGELAAVNVASTTAGRPRWRISPEALDGFLQRRQSKPPALPAPRVRRRHEPPTKSYV